MGHTSEKSADSRRPKAETTRELEREVDIFRVWGLRRAVQEVGEELVVGYGVQGEEGVGH